ncbi:MAG: hypothetical protein K6G94_00255 [Kiritimatiellae bacterium]|nr:hypothetical protein [Kiritimatiellia bacterium]
MKTELKVTAVQLLFICLVVALAYVLTGCATQKKMRDIELKGMYVNGYSEVLALGWGRLTSIPGDKEALAAHYEEDTAWLQPNVKTHKIDIFLVGTNTVASSADIIDSICKAFAEVAPAVSKENAEVAKSVATVTPLGVVKAGGEVRKAVQLAKIGAGKIAEPVGSDPANSHQVPIDCADGSCTTSDCTDGSCNP